MLIASGPRSPKVVHKSLRSSGGEKGFVLHGALDCFNEAFAAFRFQNESSSSGTQRLTNQIVAIVHCENQHFGVRRSFFDLTRDGYAVQVLQLQIDKSDVRSQFSSDPDGFLSIGRFAAYM